LKRRLPSRVDPLAELTVDFSPLAREEFLHEVRYYAARGQGLPFIAAIVEALERIRTSPHAGSMMAGNASMRRVLTKRFPFAIVYLIGRPGSSGAPLVIAVAHGSRRPEYWRRRARRPKALRKG
jgi:hypothetical protein